MKEPIADLLATCDLAALRAAFASYADNLSLPQLKRIRDHSFELAGSVLELRLGIVHTYTSDLLDPWLDTAAALEGLSLSTWHAPYGVTVQEAQPESGLLRHRPDLTLLLLRPDDLHASLAAPVSGHDINQQRELREAVLANAKNLLHAFRQHPVGFLLLTLLPAQFGPVLGHYDAQSDRSEAVWWARIKADLAALVRDSVDSALFLDMDTLVAEHGRRHFFDMRLWYSARYPFSAQGARAIANAVMHIGAGLKQIRAKVIALDADNTLWGGILGEDGLHGIALGPEYPGNAYVDFQRRLLGFQQRGFLLTLCSKNNPGDVEQVFNEHPHQLITESHLSAARVNWLDKSQNLASIAEELNLGLDSFIFVDDSDYECAAVRHQLPEVEVVQTPRRALLVPTCLDHVARLQVRSITSEDHSKTLMYAQERRRRQLRASVDAGGGTVYEFLRSLNMHMSVHFDDPVQVKRLAELSQKTNQFNLTTRRYDEAKMRDFIVDSKTLVAQFSLADTYGDSGIVGLAIWRLTGGDEAELDTFLMSCRVIGRQAEEAFLHVQLVELVGRGVSQAIADYLPTKKNSLVEDFLPGHQFVRGDDGRYRRNLTMAPPTLDEDFPIAWNVATCSGA